MIGILFIIIFGNILVSLASLVGVLTLSIRKSLLERILFYLVALSAGASLGAAMLNLIPEAIEQGKEINVFPLVITGFVIFFLLEKILFWRHCHKGECPVHSFAYLNLLGDGIHNFLDGLVIASAFLVSRHLGWTTVFAVLAHELPQEIGDFGVLLYAGFSKTRAIMYNFLTALTAIAGGIVGYFLSNQNVSFSGIVLALAAGGFIYIAASDLVPELKKETGKKESLISFAVFLLGILIVELL